ncbi:N-lysine methyltransferase SETD6 [Gracilariopsis chorda]|uniref:N-lysine methyltransferase SETD6 n=1 Tax=Gracilariopsis chorda TaxID=448386 RepID=A0A2V3IVA7_9FLOR|nr:N-lysine methyltransferase SETD6 [Gracilariopsis chorda]|eukprot:PXF46051.1 N-lysine methyltransferase SETD6 [Gracilariopsis chorda]
MQSEHQIMDSDACIQKELAGIYDRTLSDRLLAISTFDLKKKLQTCQRESGYHMPLDILQCFTTGCKPRDSCVDQSENRMLLHVGYVLTRLSGSQRGEWLNAGMRFADEMDSSADVMDLVDEHLPMWFAKLPVISLLTFFAYVCAAQQLVNRNVRGENVHVNSFLRQADEKDLWKDVRESVYKFVKARIAQCEGDVRDLEESLALLDDLNKMLPFSVVLNDVARMGVKEAWRVESHDLDGSNCLKCFERREWKWLLFEVRHDRWIDALRRLSDSRCDDVHTLVTSTEVCNAIGRHKAKGGLEWHGFRDNETVLLRPVRLQSDVMRIWEALYACSKPIVGRSGGGGRNDALMAGVEAVVEQLLLMAALFADGGERFIDGARALWRCVALRAELTEMYHSWFIPYAVRAYPRLFPPHICTFHLFQYAHSVIESRSFRIQHLTMLAPFADMANHAPAHTQLCNAKVRGYAFQHDPTIGLELYASRPIAPGEQICISYGALKNWQLLLHYGFALADNPDDGIDVSLQAPEQTMVATTLVLHLALGYTDLDFTLTLGDPLPQEMLIALRIIVLNDEERSQAATTDFTKLVSDRNERGVLQYLRSLLDALRITRVFEGAHDQFVHFCAHYITSHMAIVDACSERVAHLQRHLEQIDAHPSPHSSSPPNCSSS